MSQSESEMIDVVLATTLGTQEWEMSLPQDVAVQALIAKFVRTPDLGFRERDDAGNLIPYRLMWRQGNRFLAEAETLHLAGVQKGDTLVMAHEARAGRA